MTSTDHHGISRSCACHWRCLRYVKSLAYLVHTLLNPVQGIGRATAQLYAEEGCQRIVVADIDYPSLQDLKQELESNYKGVSVLTTLLDVRNERSVQDMIDATLATFGRIDYCANVAGIILVGDSVNLSTADFDMVYQVNLRGVFLCSKAEITAMLKQEPLSTK